MKWKVGEILWVRSKQKWRFETIPNGQCLGLEYENKYVVPEVASQIALQWQKSFL